MSYKGKEETILVDSNAPLISNSEQPQTPLKVVCDEELTLTEYKQLKHAAETTILRVIKEFEDATSGLVRYVDLDRVYLVGDPHIEGCLMHVALDVKL